MCGSAEGAPHLKRPSFLLRLLAVAGMLTGILAATATTAFASPPPSGGAAAYWDGTTECFFRHGPNESDVAYVNGPFADGANEVYFPAVGNAFGDMGLVDANGAPTTA